MILVRLIAIMLLGLSIRGIVVGGFSFPSSFSYWLTMSVFIAFMAGGMSLRVANAPKGECPSAHCSKGKCEGTYMTHDSFLDEPSFWCGAGADLLVETCKFAHFDWRKMVFLHVYVCVCM